MFSSIKIAMVLIVLAGAGGGVVYVKTLKADLETAKANQAKLESAVEDQKAVIKQQIEDIKSINKANQEIALLNKKLAADVSNLQNKFSKINASGKKRDLGNLAKSKPKLMNRVFNKATKNALRCTEIAMGAPLTEKERNAKKKSEINPECPAIANPSYVPYGN